MRTWSVASLTVLLFAAVSSAQTGGLFSRDAVPVGASGSVSEKGGLSVRVVGIDDDRSSGFPAKLLVKVKGRNFERAFDFGLNAEVLWSPAGSRFAVTGSEGGANGQYRTAIATVAAGGLSWLDVTTTVARTFGHPVKCGYREVPNVGALDWLSDRQLVVVAQIINHSNCDSFGTFVAYEIDVTSGRVLQRRGQLEAKTRWRSVLGSELANAPDECVRTPQACFVATNHPELNKR